MDRFRANTTVAAKSTDILLASGVGCELLTEVNELQAKLEQLSVAIIINESADPSHTRAAQARPIHPIADFSGCPPSIPTSVLLER